MDKYYFLCVTRDTVIKIECSKIVYFESDGNYTTVMTVDNYKSQVNMNLGNVMLELQRQLGTKAHYFIRIGKRHIINKAYFCSLNVLRQQMVLSDSDRFFMTLSMSRDALKKFKSDYFDNKSQGFSYAM